MKNVWIKCIALMLLLCMAFVFVACDGGDEPTKSTGTTENKGPAPEIPGDENPNGPNPGQPVEPGQLPEGDATNDPGLSDPF